VAGDGTRGYAGDGGPPTSARFTFPSAVVLDGSGNIYIADSENHRIRFVQTIGAAALSITTTSPLPQGTVGVAYSQTLSATGGASPYTWSVASGALPGGLALASSGTISGTPATAGAYSFTVQVKDSAAATATMTLALTIATAPPAIATSSALPQAFVGVAYSQTLTAAGGSAPYTWSVTSGALPGGLTLSGGGTISGTPTTAGSFSFTVQVRDSAGATATKAFTLAVVAGGSSIITTVAGTGTAGFSGDGGPAASAQLYYPNGVALDGSGNLYIGDYYNHRVRKVSPGGIITTVAGTGSSGFSGDGGPATSAQLSDPSGLALDGSGNIYIADEGNNRIRLVQTVKIPQIGSGGIVNNASYNLGSSAVAPGEIAAVFGTNLTDGTSCLPPSCNPVLGSDGRLNITLAGAQVTVNGIPAPIFYATPAQLGVQIPFEVSGTSASAVVSVAGQASAPAIVTVAPASPGIFTATSDGKGAGTITHVNGSAVTTQNPAQRGELVILYATGLGQVAPAVPTGALPAGASSTVSPVVLTIGGIVFVPDFAGLAGCCIGLNQINARIPSGVSPGNAVPVVLWIGGQSSNTVTIAVQ
jgi:uncharacterized protein (TIGR03437 family)